MLTLGAPGCNTSEIPPVFAPTGWRTVAFDHVTFEVADYQKEASTKLDAVHQEATSKIDTINGDRGRDTYVGDDAADILHGIEETIALSPG